MKKEKEELESILMPKDKELFTKELNDKKEELFKIIPELRDEDGFEQKNPWHTYDVWMHTLKALEFSKPNFDIRVALLLHDIGKPHSYQDDGEVRHFKGHSKKSAEIAKNVLKRLGYDKKKIKDITYLIENHSKAIDTDNINKDNLEITKKLFYIQFYDASAYSEEYANKAFKNLTLVGQKIGKKQEKIREQIDTER